jgi:hypothetical protein
MRSIVGLKERKYEDTEKCIFTSFVFCAPLQILLERSSGKE